MSGSMFLPKKIDPFRSTNRLVNPLGNNSVVNPIGGILDKTLGGVEKKLANITKASVPQDSGIDPASLNAPTIADPAAQKAAEEALKKAQRNRGRAATILSGSQDQSAAKTLLGG